MRIDTTTAPDPDEIRLVEEALRTSNMRWLGAPPSTVAAFLRDGGGRVRGGAVGLVRGAEFYLSLLWIDESLRGQGHGRDLMRGIEGLARAQGCRRSTLDTYDFQAPGFYERLGYEPIGRIADFIHGHGRAWYRKALA